jgi:hypothetical protein
MQTPTTEDGLTDGRTDDADGRRRTPTTATEGRRRLTTYDDGR